MQTSRQSCKSDSCNTDDLGITQIKTTLKHNKWNLERILIETNNLHGDGMLTGTVRGDDLTMNCTQGSGRDDEKEQKRT